MLDRWDLEHSITTETVGFNTWLWLCPENDNSSCTVQVSEPERVMFPTFANHEETQCILSFWHVAQQPESNYPSLLVVWSTPSQNCFLHNLKHFLHFNRRQTVRILLLYCSMYCCCDLYVDTSRELVWKRIKSKKIPAVSYCHPPRRPTFSCSPDVTTFLSCHWCACLSADLQV